MLLDKDEPVPAEAVEDNGVELKVTYNKAETVGKIHDYLETHTAARLAKENLRQYNSHDDTEQKEDEDVN